VTTAPSQGWLAGIAAVASVRLALVLLARDPGAAPTSTEELVRTIVSEVLPPLEKHPELLGENVARDELAAALVEMRGICETPGCTAAEVNLRVQRVAELVAPAHDSPAMTKVFWAPAPDNSHLTTELWLEGMPRRRRLWDAP
jgi:hypothetical protein